jgi:hypothetical protein
MPEPGGADEVDDGVGSVAPLSLPGCDRLHAAEVTSTATATIDQRTIVHRPCRGRDAIRSNLPRLAIAGSSAVRLSSDSGQVAVVRLSSDSGQVAE